ncbi:MAG: HAMP domain-containing histidine kinase [Clostridia bacterium]|nr:HAMP domain-containing histidine kinase [Clostridia bacterium]
MIKRLRVKFIKISTLAVAGVMLLLCVILNTANFISTDRKLNETLNMISSNRGRMPMMMHDEIGKPDAPGAKPFDEESPFSTRYFTLNYSSDGQLLEKDLTSIAAVTEENIDTYLQIALSHGVGDGYTSGYKYLVTPQSDGSFTAIFLNDSREINSVITIAVLSLAASAVCIALITVIIILFSKKAIDPVIKANEQQKQFITDAGHELKTPITVIATSLTVLEMEVGKQKWIDKAKAQTEKLKELVNSLVSLSKLDEEQTPFEFTEFDISSALTETADSFTDYAQSLGHKINSSIPEGIRYNGDEYSVRRVASILIDNAVKYACDGSDIDFTLSKHKRGVKLSCKNRCDNVSEEDLGKLFDRFYRADKSRSSEKKGFGIGLSMVRSIAEAHKGEAKAELDEEGNIIFTVILK